MYTLYILYILYMYVLKLYIQPYSHMAIYGQQYYVYIYILLYIYIIYILYIHYILYIYIYHLYFIQLTISSCYSFITLTLGLTGRDGGLITLCHSCRFYCQQRVLKMFPDPCYLRSGDGVVQLWHLLVNLCVYIYIYIYL